MADAPVAADPETAEPSAESTARCRPAVVAGAAALCLAVAIGVPWLPLRNEGGAHVFGSYLPLLPVALLFLAASLWNPVVARLLGGGWRLRTRELIVAYALLLAVAGVARNGFADQWRALLFAEWWLGEQAAYAEVAEAYPDRLGLEGDEPGFERMIRGFESGGEPLSALPWRPLVGPGLWGLLLGACGLLLAFGLIAFTARQWARHERLQHPLNWIPSSLGERSVVRSRGFRVALLAMAVFWCWNLTAAWGWQPLPAIPPKIIRFPELHELLLMAEAGDGWGGYLMRNYWGTLYVVPLVVGVGFLLTPDLSFSVWGGFWLGVVVFGWLAAAGFDVSFTSHGTMMSGGATLAMAVLIAYSGRHHYWALLRRAFGAAADVGDDRVGVWGARVLLGAGAAMVLLAVHLCDGWGSPAAWLGAVCGLLLLLVWILIVARVVAETGLVSFQMSYGFSSFAYSLGLPLLLPVQVLYASLWIGQTMMEDTRESIAGFGAKAGGLGERHRLALERLLPGMALIAVVCLPLALASGLAAGWVNGLKPFADPFQPGDALAPGKLLAVDQEGAAGFLSTAVVGAALILAVAAARRRFVGFPFNPLGLIVAFSWPLYTIWGSLLLGWLWKVLTLRYGGVQLYWRLRPVALGIIIGDLMGIAVQYTMWVIGQYAGYDFPIHLRWPRG